MASSAENWERLVHAVLKQDQAGVVGIASAGATPSLGSAASIERILQAAEDVVDDDPNVARILCKQAYTMARNLDPSSAGRGVLQFKTGLASVITRKHATKYDGASIDRRNDVRVLWNFYLEYKSRRRFDDTQREEQERPREPETFSTEMGLAGALEMEKTYATLRALLDVFEMFVRQAPTDSLAGQTLEEPGNGCRSFEWHDDGLPEFFSDLPGDLRDEVWRLRGAGIVSRCEDVTEDGTRDAAQKLVMALEAQLKEKNAQLAAVKGRPMNILLVSFVFVLGFVLGKIALQ